MPVTIGLGVASPDERTFLTIRAVGGEVDLVLFSPPGIADSLRSVARVIEAKEPETHRTFEEVKDQISGYLSSRRATSASRTGWKRSKKQRIFPLSDPRGGEARGDSPKDEKICPVIL